MGQSNNINSFTKLDLRAKEIDPKQMKIIAFKLELNVTLIEVDLSHNYLGKIE